MTIRNWKLSPSDFAFLWLQCKRCFYLKVVHGIRQPSMPMAGIFKRIEGLQMKFYDGRPTMEICPALPSGSIRCGERWVESEVIRLPGRESSCYIAGKIDSLIEFEKEGWGILDFKTTEVKIEKAALYGRQLHAYAYSLENPAKTPLSIKGEAPHLSPITRLGLLCFEPSALDQPASGRHAYHGEVRWIDIPRDDDKFLRFVGEILDVLEGNLPSPGNECDWCNYATRIGDFKASAPTTSDSPPSPPCPKCGASMRRRHGKFGEFLSCTTYPACKGTRNLTTAT